MVGTIIPIVHGESIEGRRSYRALWLYACAMLAGGALTGLVVGYSGQMAGMEALGGLRSPLLLLGMALLYLLLSGRELGVWRFPMPQPRWQVPRHWQVALGRPMAVLAYGAILGSGVFTAISSGSFYPLLMWPAVLGSPAIGLAGFAAFAIGRTIPVIALVKGAGSVETAWRWVPLLDGCHPIMKVVNAVAMAASGGLMFGMALGAG